MSSITVFVCNYSEEENKTIDIWLKAIEYKNINIYSII